MRDYSCILLLFIFTCMYVDVFWELIRADSYQYFTVSYQHPGKN